MKKNVLFLIILLTSMTAYSQAKIESEGIASVSVKPDIGILTLSLNSIWPSLRYAVENLNNETSQLTKQLSQLKLEDYKENTSDFSVRVNKIFKNSGYKDSGYVASQQLIIEFKNSKENISRILNSFLENYGDLNFHFSFQASESLRSTVEKRMVELATIDAMEKAHLLASSAKLSLGKIIEIKHGNLFFNGNPPITLRNLNEVIVANNNPGFESRDLRFSDNVLVVFELK